MIVTQTLDGERLLNGVEAAYYLGRSVTTLHRLVKTGRLSSVKRGRDRFYRLSEIETLVAAGPNATADSPKTMPTEMR